jgi:hypothetical protein
MALAIMPPGLVRAQTVDGSSPIISSEISVSRREATLKLELTGGHKLDIAMRDGRVFSGGRDIGQAQRGEALDRAWRDLLNGAIDAPTDQLARMLVAWEAPGSDVGRRVDAMLESALTGVEATADAMPPTAEAEVQAFDAQTSDSVHRLVERITQLERMVDELEDAPAPQIRIDRQDRSFGWLGPFRHIVRGVAGILSILVTYAVLFGIGLATIFFGGRRYIEGVADTARRATMRSLLVGLAATFLVIPAFILGIIALAISIVGIPALLVWIPLFPVAAGLAVLLGYIGVAHAAGEALAERRFYASDWFQRGNSYYFLMTGLGLLMSLFIASQVVAMAGPWLGFFRGALVALGVVVTWAALSVGLGAVLLSRGGTRPVQTFSGPEPEIYAEEAHV